MNDALAQLATAHGILPRYVDTTGTERHTSPDTARALLRSLGVAVENPSDEIERLAQAKAKRKSPEWIVIDPGKDAHFPWLGGRSWQIELDGGAQIEGRGNDDLPGFAIGIHKLWSEGRLTTILTAPKRLDLPERCWGVTVPLWGLRTPKEGGLGDFSDLARLARSIGDTGPGFLGINPVHAGFPTDPDAISPYQPSHRRRLNVQHIGSNIAAAKGDLINYPAEVSARLQALEAEFAGFTGDPDFDAFCDAGGDALRKFACHQGLSDLHGPYWTDWPAAEQDPTTCSTPDPARVAFHMWLQWKADRDLSSVQDAARKSGMRHGLYLDLAVGTHPHGAETWEDRESFVRGASLGAPPDALGPNGQVWNLAPFHPGALVQQSFEPLAETIRMQFRHCGVLRIDHVLGFDRAFWVPDDGSPGGYVSMPRAAMLAVARIEAARAGGVIVGEDLGVVPDGLREDLEASGILGCRLAIFEREGAGFKPAKDYPEAAIASFSTHDLPTWKGWREAEDIGVWAALGSVPDQAKATEERARDVAAFDDEAGDTQADSTLTLHEFLAETPSRLVAVQAETLFEIVDQPNLPGTVDEHPNWRRRLPATDLARRDTFRATARIMKDHGRD